MNPEKRICQSCQAQFVIEPEDFGLYEKFKVPPPTWCPMCRAQRRMAWWNERYLHRTKDSVTGKEILSGTDDFSSAKVVDKDYWFSDNWDQNASGREYDWNKPFLLQFKELLNEAPIPNRFFMNFINSEYCNNATDVKNSYLIFGCTFIEDSAFLDNSTRCRQLFDSSYMADSEIAYESFFNKKCYRSFFSSHCEYSHDIYFSRDCIGCSNCVGCVGLKNKKYHFFNQPLSKEDYEKEFEQLNLSSYKNLQILREKIKKFWLEFPVRYVHGLKNEHCVGEYIFNSKNVRQSYYVNSGENLKYCQGLYSAGGKDSYDQYRYGLNSEMIYECTAAGGHSVNCKFSFECYHNSRNVEYSFVVNSSSNMFGCVAMHHKKFCILNKQYSEVEYKKLVPKIIQHMKDMPYVDKMGRVYAYGEFFPPEISPYPYNDTTAQEFFPLTESEALKRGFLWRASTERRYTPDINFEDLPDDSGAIIVENFESKIVSCEHDGKCKEHCATAFRFTLQELQFYKAMGLPLPRVCPNCRYYARIAQKNPLKLCRRTCQCAGEKSENGAYKNSANHRHGNSHCAESFETSYAPDRPEIVYCEGCYQQEVA